MKVTSTSRNSASVDDIVLRENQVTRLVFRPLLVNNEQDQRASLKGAFVFQRKGQSQQWEDHRTLALNRLKAGEGIKLELSSKEVLQLYQELGSLYALYDEEGIPSGEVEYVRAASGLAALLKTSDKEFEQLLQESGNNGQELLERILNWIISKPNPARILDHLESLDAEQLGRLSSLAGLQALKAILQLSLIHISAARPGDPRHPHALYRRPTGGAGYHGPVSYTHLDVYKRQGRARCLHQLQARDGDRPGQSAAASV